MDIYKGLYKDSIMQFYFMFMLRNKCSVSIHFGNVRNIQCLLCLVFLQFMCKERGVKSFQKREQDIFFVFTLKNVFIANGAFIGTEKAELHSLFLRTTAVFQQNKFSN